MLRKFDVVHVNINLLIFKNLQKSFKESFLSSQFSKGMPFHIFIPVLEKERSCLFIQLLLVIINFGTKGNKIIIIINNVSIIILITGIKS